MASALAWSMSKPMTRNPASEKRFQPVLPHPHRCAFHLADCDVKASAHAHGEWNLHFSLVPAEKLLLFWRAHGNEQQVGPAVGNQLDDARLLFGSPVAVPVAGDLQVRESLFIEGLKGLHTFLPGAEKENAPSLLGGAFYQEFEQVDARHPFLKRLPEQP